MSRSRLWTGVVALVAFATLSACHREARHTPPPEARRPVIPTEAELAAERDARIASGQVVPTTEPPRTAAEGPAPVAFAVPVPIPAPPGAIEADVLLVNDEVLTLPAALYPLWPRIADLRRTQTPQGAADALARLLRARVQQEIGALLIYKEATAKLSDPQRKIIDEEVGKEVKRRVSRDFGGSQARFEHHLTRHGLNPEKFRKHLERDMVARQYIREKLLPQLSVSRGELLECYRRHGVELAAPETRTLRMIEAPFEAFLPPGRSWAQASPDEQAAARAKAARHIREAHAALAEQPFEEVARRLSKGVHAPQGGVWGEIARPLQRPYDQVSAVVFQLDEGKYSEPIETERGWYLVQCGPITPARHVTFADVQEELRQRLVEQKYDKLAAEYLIRLSQNATVTALEAFIRAGVRRAMEEPLEALSTSE